MSHTARSLCILCIWTTCTLSCLLSMASLQRVKCTLTLFCGLVSTFLCVPSQSSTRAVIRFPQGRPFGEIALLVMPTCARARSLPSSRRACILTFARPAAAQQHAQQMYIP